MNRELGEIEAYYARIGYSVRVNRPRGVAVYCCWTHGGDSV
jgi:hypothetical protein